MQHVKQRGRLLAGALVLATFASVGTSGEAQAQWSRTYEQFYLPGNFNFTFRREYASADRLFNAFDYGHAILYERLYTRPGAPASMLERDEYDFVTRKLLVNPPKLPLEEAAIEINYAKLAPEAKMMFDWAHLLHRQIYDVLASENMNEAQKDAKIAELVAYYKTRKDLAFSSLPKNMDLMEMQPYSLAFRQRYPKFNGLIWGYHWLQVALYEPMLLGRTQEERQTGVTAAVARFKQMLENAPENMPRIMPMTSAIAPTFAARYQEAAIIFDNLHSMHDVVSDILTNNSVVPRSQKRAEILAAASLYRDATSYPMPLDQWRTMGQMMGIANMGGPSVGFTSGFPAATLPRGTSMALAMRAMNHGPSAMPGMAGMNHGADSTAGGKGAMPGMAGMNHGADSSSAMTQMPGMMQMHERMMRDPVIRERVMADTAMRRMMQQMDAMHGGMQHDMKEMAVPAAGHDMSTMSHDAAPAASRATPAPRGATRRSTPARRAAPSTRAAPVKKATPAKKTAPKKAPAPAKKPAPRPAPMDHSRMPGMNMPGMKP